MSRALTLLFLLSLFLAACSKPEVPTISGVWVGEAASEYATTPVRLELVQTGQTLTGVATLAGTLESDNLTGKVDAQQITLSFSYDLGSISGGNDLIARYAFVGTVTGSTMTGDANYSVEGSGPPLLGTFKFQKQP